jgi:hypothetical protein
MLTKDDDGYKFQAHATIKNAILIDFLKPLPARVKAAHLSPVPKPHATKQNEVSVLRITKWQQLIGCASGFRKVAGRN